MVPIFFLSSLYVLGGMNVQKKKEKEKSPNELLDVSVTLDVQRTMGKK